MFERLMKRGEALAARRAAARRNRLADAVRAAAPAGVAVDVEGEALVLSGRGLGRRLANDPAVRWLVAEARHEQ
jgi:hypothetical protein